MAEKHRIRTEKYSLSLLPEELALLKKNAFEFGLSQADYLRKIILYGGMTGRQWTMDKEQGKQLLYQISKIGNNINQIAYRINVDQQETNEEWNKLIADYLELLELMGKLPFLRKEDQEEWQQQVYMLLQRR